MIRKHFRLKRIALGLAFAAIAAPVAQATPEIQAGLTAPSSAYLSTEVSPYELRSTHIVPGGMTLVQPSIVRSENSFGAPGPSAAGATGPQHVISATSSSRFDWTDASLGAAAAFATALLLLTAVGLGRRNRSGLANA
jgi:hypothetical protein